MTQQQPAKAPAAILRVAGKFQDIALFKNNPVAHIAGHVLYIRFPDKRNKGAGNMGAQFMAEKIF
jgi:hypothetical protein